MKKEKVVSRVGEIVWRYKSRYSGSIYILMSYHRDDIPDNLLLCDGSHFDPTKYPELYTLLGECTLPTISNINTAYAYIIAKD